MTDMRHAVPEFQQGIRPPSALTVSEWASANVPAIGSERSRMFDIRQYPWWREPLDSYRDPSIKIVVAVAPTGSGKSTMAYALMNYIIAEDQGDAYYATQSNETAKHFSRSKLLPSIRGCKPSSELLSKNRHDTKTDAIYLRGMYIGIGGANYTNFQEHSLRTIWGDEVWQWDDGLVKEYLARHHERYNRKAFFVSQGGFVGTEFFRLHDDCLQKKFAWHCKKCDAWNPFRNGDIVVEDTKTDAGTTDVFETAKTAAMQCPCCGDKVADTASNRYALATGGKYLTTKDSKNTEAVSFSFPRCVIPWVTWGDVWKRFHAANVLRKRGIYQPFIEYKQKHEAEFWDENQGSADQPVAISNNSLADYESGEMIDGEVCRVLSMDRGLGHFWYVVAAWDGTGTMHVLNAGYLDGEKAAKTVEEKYKIEARRTFLDVGWEMEDSIAICIRNGWVGIRGEKNKTFAHFDKRGRKTEKIYSKPQMHQTTIGKGAFFFIAAHEFKNILARMRTAGKLTVPDDVTPHFAKHLEGEVLREDTAPKTGAKTYYWKRIKDNHLFDCCVYNIAAAYILGACKDGTGGFTDEV